MTIEKLVRTKVYEILESDGYISTVIRVLLNKSVAEEAVQKSKGYLTLRECDNYVVDHDAGIAYRLGDPNDLNYHEKRLRLEQLLQTLDKSDLSLLESHFTSKK
jgi:hypothetical protein